jgi:hypothetical protein
MLELKKEKKLQTMEILSIKITLKFLHIESHYTKEVLVLERYNNAKTFT